jgi:hypothetical protein
MENFKLWLENLDEAVSSPWTTEDIPSEVVLTGEQILKYASNPTLKDGSPNWAHANYNYWMKNKKAFFDKIMAKFQEPGVRSQRAIPGDPRHILRSQLRNIGFSILQSRVEGGASRKNHVYALYRNADPTTVLQSGYEDAKPLPGENPYIRTVKGKRWDENPIDYHMNLANHVIKTGKLPKWKKWEANGPTGTQDKELWKMYKSYLKKHNDQFTRKIPTYQQWYNHMSQLHN